MAKEVTDPVSNTVGVDPVPIVNTGDVDQHLDNRPGREVSLHTSEADDAW